MRISDDKKVAMSSHKAEKENNKTDYLRPQGQVIVFMETQRSIRAKSVTNQPTQRLLTENIHHWLLFTRINEPQGLSQAQTWNLWAQSWPAYSRDC